MVQASSGAGAARYRRLAELAETPTARVELCRVGDGPSARLVAIKRLHTAVASDPQFLTMFRDEMWITAHLKHPNAVEVLDWGEDERGPYLVMELVRGVSLARLLRTVSATGEEFPERLIVYLGASVSAGLAAAHALETSDGRRLQLVHRDLTPANVLMSFDGDVKIADFGLAKAEQRVTQTITGVLKGDPEYMAPEHLRGEAIDGRADLFALGVLLFELFAQRRPWNTGGNPEGFAARISQEPADLGVACPRIDRNLVALVHRCLMRDPAARPATADEVHAELCDWLQAHRYEDNRKSLSRFVRRNALRQKRWLERAIHEAGPDALSEDIPTLTNAFLEEVPPTTARRGPEEETATSQPSLAAPLPLEPPPRVVAKTLDMAAWTSTDSVTERPRQAPGVVSAPDPAAPPPPARGGDDPEGSTQRRPRVASGQTHSEPMVPSAALRELCERYARESAQLAAEATAAAEAARQAAALAEGAAAVARELAARLQTAQEALRATGDALAAAANGDGTRARAELARAERLRASYRRE